MAFTSKLPLLLFVLFLSTITLALAHQYEQDPQREYQQCQQRCQQQEQQQQQCQQRCEQQRREQEESQRDPQQQYQQCQRRCQQQEQQQQQQCQQRCEQQQQREQEQGEKGQGESKRYPQQEYQQCQRRCQQQEQGQQQQCQQRCEEKRREQEREQQQRDPQQQFQECQQRCQQHERGQRQQQQQCQQRCEEERRRQEEQQQGGNPREQQQQQEQQRNNPYFLDEQSFEERFKTQHGYTRVSRRFSQLSNLLRGIENYRLALFEANPSTFMIPNHFDADAIFFVVRGRGIINLVQQQNKESYHLERGDVIRVPAGALIYLINKDNNDKFQIASLFRPVSTPTDRFREFFAVGGENPESFFKVFSDDILEAAFNAEKERVDKLFSQQRRGEIVEASQEQIRALSREASPSSREGSPRSSRYGSRSRGPYNLLNQRPEHSNEYGQLHRIDANDYSQLQDLDVEVAFYNINKGAMVVPFYNSRATSLVVVVEGRGRFEMACPHLSSSQSQSGSGSEGEQQEGGSAHYQRVSARLSPRTAFIVPAGHPVSIVASDNENLQIVAFKINAENNQRNYLAGRNNLLNQLETEAKELSFNMQAREVEGILNNQRHSVFLPGPSQRQQREEGRHGGLLLETIAAVLAF